MFSGFLDFDDFVSIMEELPVICLFNPSLFFDEPSSSSSAISLMMSIP